MALNIISNFAANVAHRNLTVNDRRATSEISKLSSGLRVLGARDDAASLAIGSRLRAEVGALRQANVNAGQAGSLLQVADGALNTVGDILFRLKVLAVQSGSDNVGEAERNSLQLEFGSLQQEIDRIAGDTEFNGVRLINGENRVITQVGDDEAAQAGAGLRLIDSTIGTGQGITDVKFSDGFSSTLVEIAYAADGQNGTFTVTDLSQPIGSAAGRTATGSTILPLTPGVATDVQPGQTETIDVVFDRGGVNERTVSITINSEFAKRTFNPTRLQNTANLANTGFAAADTFTVTGYGGNLAGLSTQIVADATSAITASTLRIANSGGDELVATSTVDFNSTDAQNVRFQNSQGDFVEATITLTAALAAANYAQLQDGTDAGTSLTLTGLNGQGNDLVTGSLAVRATAIATPGTIASLVNSGDLSVREIGGTGSNTPLSLSYTASTNSFTGTIGDTTGSASTALSGINGQAGKTVVTVGNRVFEVTVSAAFNRNSDIQDATSRVTALPSGLAANFNDGDFSFRINSFTPGTDQTTEGLLGTLTSTNFVIAGAADGVNLGFTLGDYTNADVGVEDIAATGNAGNSVTATLTDATTGNSINVTVTNNSANAVTSTGAADAAGATATDALLDEGETIAFQANRLASTAFLSEGGRTQASFDVTRVSGDLAGLDNRIRFARGPASNVLGEAVLSIDHSDARRGNLTAVADLTQTGFQVVTLRNTAGDTVTLNINLSSAITETQINRRDTSAESFVLLGELRQSVTFGSSFNDRRSFSFKIGSGVLADDSVTFDVGAANLRALGLEGGADGIRIDGVDNVNSDVASVAVTRAIDRLNDVRAIIGAGQNRLEFASNNVAVAIENAEAARSTLLDLDVAAGISAFTSSQILVQAGISILAQANQQPQQLLRLFQ